MPTRRRCELSLSTGRSFEARVLWSSLLGGIGIDHIREFETGRRSSIDQREQFVAALDQQIHQLMLLLGVEREILAEMFIGGTINNHRDEDGAHAGSATGKRIGKARKPFSDSIQLLFLIGG